MDAYVFNITSGQVTTGELTAASATLTSTGTAPANNDTVTIGAVTYTFKTALTGGGATANEVLIGASASIALDNLKSAINLTAGGGTTYGSATVIHPTVTASTKTATTLLLVAKTSGTGGNSLASTETSAQLSFGGATFSGGVNNNIEIAKGVYSKCTSISSANLNTLVTAGCVAFNAGDSLTDYVLYRLHTALRFKLANYNA